jgi:N-acetyl-anhydromuramyl-L-alanine amidase AmpD
MAKVTPKNLQDGLPFVKAKGFRQGKPGRKVKYLVIHTMDSGSESPKMAENLASYTARRTDCVSHHEQVDNNSVVCSVRPNDIAWTTGSINSDSYSWELAGWSHQTKAQWADDYSTAMLALAAKRVAAACVAFAIPPVRLTVAELKAGKKKGIIGHIDHTLAYNPGGHTDPGANFPWKKFIAAVAAEVAAIEATGGA